MLAHLSIGPYNRLQLIKILVESENLLGHESESSTSLVMIFSILTSGPYGPLREFAGS